MNRLIIALFVVLGLAQTAEAQYRPTSLEGWLWKIQGNEFNMLMADNSAIIPRMVGELGWSRFDGNRLQNRGNVWAYPTDRGLVPVFENKGGQLGRPLQKVTKLGNAMKVGGLLAGVAGLVVAAKGGDPKLAAGLTVGGGLLAVAGDRVRERGGEDRQGQESRQMPVPPPVIDDTRSTLFPPARQNSGWRIQSDTCNDQGLYEMENLSGVIAIVYLNGSDEELVRLGRGQKICTVGPERGRWFEFTLLVPVSGGERDDRAMIEPGRTRVQGTERGWVLRMPGR